MAADVYSSDYGDYGMPDMSNGSNGPKRPGDPGTYVGHDGNWYDESGNNLGPSGQAPTPPHPTHGGIIDPGTGKATVGQPTAPAPPPTGGDQLASPAQQSGFFPDYAWTPYSSFTPFQFDSYAPLTADQAASEPGYAFARNQGRDAVQTAQASKGNVLSGAALKDLFAWGDQFAGQNYQNAEARNENVYGLNRSNAFNNWAANETGKYQQWQGNLQPAQFAASLKTNQGGLTLADLLGRFSTTASILGNIAAAGAK